jgi:hypothetical protein
MRRDLAIIACPATNNSLIVFSLGCIMYIALPLEWLPQTVHGVLILLRYGTLKPDISIAPSPPARRQDI